MVQVNNNYGLKINCPICNEQSDSQEHLFQCNGLNNNGINDTFICKLERLVRRREVILENKNYKDKES